MTQHTISAQDPYPRQRIAILDSEMAYIDTAPNGASDPIVLLHGNPTSSYLWRNIIPYLSDQARCLAPDLIGMGQSGKNPTGSYRFMDHYRYLAAWFEAVGLKENVTLVVHDWGSALGFHWAYEQYKAYQGLEGMNAVKAIVYMEALVRPVTWEEWPDSARGIFQGMRSPKGEELILERNFFVERILPSSILREMDEEAMNVYRQPFLEAGEVRRPTLTWPREIPIGGEPADMVEIIDGYAHWLATSEIPKLFISAEPGIILTGPQREFCRTWNNQQEVTVSGLHFIQEDSPDEIGEAIADFVEGLG